jgi:ATP:ADP antiporter, AAA family
METAAPGVRRFRSLEMGMSACWWRTFFPALSLFLLTATFIVTKTGRDSLYFAQTDALSQLPAAYLGLAILSVPAAQGTLGLMRWLGPRRARVAGLAIMAAVQLVIFAVVRPGGGWGMTLIFILIPLLYGVLLSLSWLLGADLLDLAPRHVLARLYSTIGASSLLGGLTGAALARNLAASIDPRSYVLLGVGGLLLTALVNVAAHRAFPAVRMHRENDLPVPSTEGGEIPATPGILPLLGDRYVALLAAIALLGSIVGVLIEFQFYASTAGRASMAKTFADFYLWLNGAALILQVFVTPALQRRVGVYGSLLVLPVSLVGGASLALATGSAAARAALRIAEGGIKSSVHRSSWEQSYLPVDRASRAPVKLLVDGMAARIGESLAAVLLVAGAMFFDTTTITRILLASTLLWLFLTILLGRSLAANADLSELRPDLPIPDG